MTNHMVRIALDNGDTEWLGPFATEAEAMAAAAAATGNGFNAEYRLINTASDTE